MFSNNPKQAISDSSSTGKISRFFRGCIKPVYSQQTTVPVSLTNQTIEEKQDEVVVDGFTVTLSRSITCRAVIDDEIGKGAFATVHKATWAGMTIAVKSLKSRAPSHVDDFRHEAAKMFELNKLKLSCIATYYGYEEDTQTQRYCIYMEYFSGQSLYQVGTNYYKSGDDIPLKKAATLLTKATNACAEISKHAIVHSDIKAENMILTKDGSIKLIDWCFALCLVDQESCQLRKVRGTSGYIAPEILTKMTYSEASDVFAIGSLICIFANEQVPFDAVNSAEIDEKIKKGERHPLSSHCNPFFKKLIMSCWQQDPKDRPTMAEVNAELDQFKNTHSSFC